MDSAYNSLVMHPSQIEDSIHHCSRRSRQVGNIREKEKKLKIRDRWKIMELYKLVTMQANESNITWKCARCIQTSRRFIYQRNKKRKKSLLYQLQPPSHLHYTIFFIESINTIFSILLTSIKALCASSPSQPQFQLWWRKDIWKPTKKEQLRAGNIFYSDRRTLFLTLCNE